MMRIRGLSPRAIGQLLGQSVGLRKQQPKHVFLCIADHFEPMLGNVPLATERERVARWVQQYPESVERFSDSRGRPPQHTFFYPAEAYSREHLDNLAQLCRRGYGDIEVHLHHDRDNADNLRETLTQFTHHLHLDHGLLAKDERGQITYGFIHGNWALDNSRPDGRWCGVNNELSILRETGCYADFTMPSAPDPCQTQTINQIYYAADDPTRPKSHDRGVRAMVGGTPLPSSLLMVQGPLALDWSKRKAGILPGLENGELHGGRLPTRRRLALWLSAHVSVAGRPEWAFVKLHTHGANERNAEMLLGDSMRRFHAELAVASEESEFRYYYVTAREMVNLIHQAETGLTTPQLGIARPREKSNCPARQSSADSVCEVVKK